jgi:hypothetical protein
MSQHIPKLATLFALALLTAWVAVAARPELPTGTIGGSVDKIPAHISTPLDRPRIEVAFVLDTTGSMSGLIEGAKQKIWSIANQMASGQPAPEIRIGLIGYRDRGDAYVTRVFELTDDLDEIYGQLRQFRAEGGGDTPESVNQALHEAVSGLSWTPGTDTYKVIFLVGDAPPHMDYANDVSFSTSVARARQQHIVVNTVQCGSLGSTTPIWQQIASGGSGQYVSIAQDGAMVAMETPMDAPLAALSLELADTVVAYGDASEREQLRDKFRRSAEAPASVNASRLSFLSKTGGRANSGRSDLIDAVGSGEANLAEVPDEALPEELRELDLDGRKSYVEEKLAKRKEVQRKIDELGRSRDAYVKKENAKLRAEGKGDGFDQQVLEAIRTQAAAAGISYND